MSKTIGKVTISDNGGLTIKGLIGSKSYTKNQILKINYVNAIKSFFWMLFEFRLYAILKIFKGQKLVIIEVKNLEKNKSPRFWLNNNELTQFQETI